jgi:hypothetical protein
MMGTIKQHIPNFVSGFDPVIQNFKTLEELLDIDFVKQWSADEDFHQFSIGPYDSRWHLMAEQNNGKRWWVVGYIIGIVRDELNLPDWKPKKGDE